MMKKAFHEQVAEQLIEQLKAGTAPWQKPWLPGEISHTWPMNPLTGNRYRGINAMWLMSKGHEDPRWMTYKQANSIGAQVRRGEQGSIIQYWKFSEEIFAVDDAGNPVVDEQGKPKKVTVQLERPRCFHATVFNAEQIDGLPPLARPVQTAEQLWEVCERAENLLKNSGADIRHMSGNKAYYRPGTDHIVLPNKKQFEEAHKYYATALHELGHWTGHPSRLDRDMGHPFGSEGYAKEELRAEISSMMVGMDLGLGHDPGQHAAYVGGWVKALQNDPLEIFRASADAEKIMSFVMAFEHEQNQVRDAEQGIIETPAMEQQPLSPADIAVQKTYIQVPYAEKKEAKELGARWDRQQQSWYVPAGQDLAQFEKWSQGLVQKDVTPKQEQTIPTAIQDKIYLAVPYQDRTAAKQAGAKWDPTAKSWYIESSADNSKCQRWLPQNVPEQGPALPPHEEFADLLRDMGALVDGEHPVMDGGKHRIKVEGDRGSQRSGFYIAYMDGHPAGYFINNRTGEETKWKSKGYSLPPEEKAKLMAEAAEKLQQRANERAELEEATAQRVQAQCAQLQPINHDQPTPYLINKGIPPFAGVFTDNKGSTFIPAFDVTGKQWTTQYISPDGTKRFAKDGHKTGCFHPLGGLASLATADAIVISEGYATAAVVAQSIPAQVSVVAAFDSGNLKPVAEALREQYPDTPIIIAGDDDRHLALMLGENVGRTKAQEAAQAVGGSAVFPVFTPAESNYPSELPLITPEAFKAHEQGKELLTDDQLAALARMKQFTDFNDVSQKSELGPNSVCRQLQVVVEKAIEQGLLMHAERQEQCALSR